MLPHRRAVAPLAVLLSLSAAVPLTAQDWTGKGRIQGTVENPEGEPMVGATVHLHPADHPEAGPEALTTNKKGRWSYLGLSGGAWTVVVEADGYVPSEGTVEVNEFGSGATVPVTLRPIPEEQKREERAKEILAWIERGNELLAGGQPAAARAEYERALPELDPDNKVNVLRAVARTYYEEGNAARAIEVLQQALEIVPDDAGALQLLINLLVGAGREEEAQSYIARLPAGEKLDPTAALNLGIDLYNKGDLDGALEHFERAVRENPESADGYYYRGLVLLNKGENEKAKADFQKLLELAPDYPEAAEVKEFLKYLEGGSG